MRYLLDTDTCIYLIKRKPKSVLIRLLQVSLGDVGISAITLGELEYGVQKSARCADNRAALAAFLRPFEILPYDRSAAGNYGKIRAHLETAGQTIGALDMLIAAHALAGNLTLVTNNEREFRRVPGIKLENWAVEDESQT